MLPPPPNINTTELARKARIRLEQTRRDIMELNSQISKTIQEAFGSPHGNDKRNDASRGRSGEKNTKQKGKRRNEHVDRVHGLTSVIPR